jgi:cleavage and polyadenylation specificity factor subunit 2
LTDEELGVNVLLRGKDVYDYDVRSKRGREKMFPFVAHRGRNDEFGDVIKPEEYLRAEERDDVDGVDLQHANAGGQDGSAAVGQKRKWDESGARERKDREQKGQNKRAKIESKHEPDDIDAIIARATGEDGTTANGTAEESTSDSDESEYEPEDDASSEPQKIVFTMQSLTLNLRVAYVDFSGLYRLNDLQGLIGRINPRKLIVTGGNASETRLLADTCRAVDNGSAVREIFTPADGEVVDASVDTNAWTVKLTRQLVRRLNWKDLGTDKPSIAAISGILGTETADDDNVKTEQEDEAAKKKLKLSRPNQQPTSDTNSEAPLLPTLDVLSSYSLPTTQHHHRAAQPVHVGDLRLADIRFAIQDQGHTAELRGGGTLLVDGTVIVRKSAMTGGIEVEAASAGLSMPGWRTKTNEGSFYAVRKVIYERLAVVAGA